MLDQQINYYVFSNIAEFHYTYIERATTFTQYVWQHIVLVTIRQYEDKSYRMFTDWLVEAYYLRLLLQLSKIPHYTTLQKFTDNYCKGLVKECFKGE